MGNVAEKLVNTTESKIKAKWVALIYYPALEVNRSTFNDNLIYQQRGGGSLIPFLRNFQFYDPYDSFLKTISIHPGTNLGHHYRDRGDNRESINKISIESFDSIFNQPLNNLLIDRKIILPVYPLQESLSTGEPQYSDFSESDALLLVESHTHEKWIDAAMVTETRPVIKTAAENRKKQIATIRTKLQEGAL